jgi:hypothetical protein
MLCRSCAASTPDACDTKAFASRTQQPRPLSFLRRHDYDTAATANFLQHVWLRRDR